MKLVMIAAMGRNRELGLDGDMPWKRGLKEDLQFFRKTTQGHAMLMGRRTFESLPGMLPGREHLVLTSSTLPEKEHLQTYPSLDAFFEDWKERDETVYVIGGGSIYATMLPYCDEMLLTEIDSAFPADTYFPAFDPDEFDRTVLSKQQDGNYQTEHVLYKRK